MGGRGGGFATPRRCTTGVSQSLRPGHPDIPRRHLARTLPRKLPALPRHPIHVRRPGREAPAMNADDPARPAAGDTETLDSLLRGELAAVAAYDRAIAEFEGQPAAADLHHIRDDHAAAVAVLREQVVRSGGAPADAPGTWGTLPAQALGPAATLKALREGEMQGVSQY